MRIWKDGDERTAICPTCERRTKVAYRRRTVELEDLQVEVKDVLVAVCLDCDGIASIPHQSTPRLRAEMNREKEMLTFRLPGHLLDVLALLADRSAPGARSGQATVLRVLLHEFGNNPSFAKHAREYLDDPLAEGPADHSLSVRVPSAVVLAMDDMAALIGIQSRTDVIRGVLVAAKEHVLDEHDPELAASMDQTLTAVA